MIIKCKVSCNSAKLKEMNIDSNEWIDYAFRLRDIIAIRSTADGDGEPEFMNKTVIFDCLNNHVIIDIPFNEFFEIWKRYDNN